MCMTPVQIDKSGPVVVWADLMWGYADLIASEPADFTMDS